MDDSTLNIAISSVTDACRIARNVQGRLDEVREITKDDRSPVTVADFAVQAVVAMALRDALGEVLIVGEEKADLLRQPAQSAVTDAVVAAARELRADATRDDVLDAIDACNHDASAGTYWTLDPVDGTKGFLRRQQYAIALARIDGGRVTLGVMGCPNLPIDHDADLTAADPHGAVYAAAAGGGAWQVDGDQRRRIGGHEADHDLKTVRVCESVEAGHSKQSDTVRILDHIGATAAPVRLDSQCKYAVVARGQADAYLRLPTRKDYVEKIWDHAAGMLIATEAGAVVTDISAAPLDFGRGARLEANRGIVCATAGIHGRLIDAISAIGIGAATA